MFHTIQRGEKPSMDINNMSFRHEYLKFRQASGIPHEFGLF